MKKIGKGNHNNHKRYYNYNREYFSSIDSGEKAYLLGFILADGHVRSDIRGYYLMFSINENDKYLLENFCIELEAPLTLVKRKSQKDGSYYLRFASKQLVLDLDTLGVPLRNKSFSAMPIYCGIFNADFWRGVFDGDGSIGINGNSLRITLAGTIDICTGFKNYLNINKGYIQKFKNSFQYQLSVSKLSDMLDIYNKLYTHCELLLKRKKERFLEIIQRRVEYERYQTPCL
jgi:DNA-binding transcriptional regulator WhiA